MWGLGSKGQSSREAITRRAAAATAQTRTLTRQARPLIVLFFPALSTVQMSNEEVGEPRGGVDGVDRTLGARTRAPGARNLFQMPLPAPPPPPTGSLMPRPRRAPAVTWAQRPA
jgi:hypothetical protein